jgi:hypothetical protein
LELGLNKVYLATEYSEELHNMCCVCPNKKKCKVYQSYFDNHLQAVDSNKLKKDLLSFYNANLKYADTKSLVQRASVAESIIGYRSGDGRKIMGFHVLLGGEKRECCRECFMKFIEIEYDGLKKLMKNNEGGYIGAGGDTWRNCTESDRGGGDISQMDVKEWLSTETVNPRECVEDNELVSNAFCIRNDKHEECHAWFQQYCTSCAEQSPEGDFSYVSTTNKEELHDVYVQDFERLSATEAQNRGGVDHELYLADMIAQGRVKKDLLSKAAFMEHWRQCFPHLGLRRECSVVGKCAVCAHLDGEGQKHNNCAEIKLALKKAKMLHRLFYQNERIAYQHRSSHARGEKRVLSVCIDIMESCDNQSPAGGSQCKFEQTIDCTYVGCLVHGVGLTMYRCTNLVGKSADVICHVVLDQLQKYFERNGCAPDVLYVQNDGGGENANACFFALLEYLVVMRFTHLILATRFPTGHGHDDGDGGFGHVKKVWKGVVMKTWEKFRTVLEEKHKMSKLNTKMEDIHYVHDYWTFFRPCFDKKLSNFQKLQETQHQFRFEAVEADVWFPLGCRVSYTAFCAKMTVEGNIRSAPGSALTDMGFKIGIDFTRTYSKWYPDENTYPERPVFGFHLLTCLPTEPLHVKMYDEESRVAMEKTRMYLISSPKLNDDEKAEWADFFRKYLPVNDVPYHPNGVVPFIPLQSFIGAPLLYRPPNERVAALIDEKRSVEVEELTLCALAMPSVKCSWDVNPPQPRLFINKTAEQDANYAVYHDTLKNFVLHMRSKETPLFGCSVEYMNNKLYRMANLLGKELVNRPPTRGEKCKKLYSIGKDFYNFMYAPLLAATRICLGTMLNIPYTSEAEKLKVVRVIGTFKLLKHMLREDLDSNIVNCLYTMFQSRDTVCTQMHQQHYMNDRVATYYPMLPSVFLSVEDGQSLLNGENILGNPNRLHCVYIPYLLRVSETQCVWTIILIQCHIRQFSFVTPVSFPGNRNEEGLAYITLKLNATLETVWPNCTMFKTEMQTGLDRYSIPDLSVDGSVAWLYAATYFILYGLPVEIYERAIHILILRCKYFLSMGKLYT